MSLCAQEERANRHKDRLALLRRTGYGTPALLAHDVEHEWRCAGEWAIREEMERRLAAHRDRRTARSSA